MDIHQLELFLAVVNSPSMTRAAQKVCLSPGAVSLQLHNLAEELHTELFVRGGKRLIPTPAALRLAEQAKVLVKRKSSRNSRTICLTTRARSTSRPA
jgi:DNA-binding transcriptional LysR family regulator